MKTKLEREIVGILDETGLPWSLKWGKGDHLKVFLNYRYVGTFGVGGGNTKRAHLNLKAQIRRATKEHTQCD